MHMTTYILARLTGSDLVDSSGRATGPEIARVLSRHRNLWSAYRAMIREAGVTNCPTVLNRDGSHLSSEDSDQIRAYLSGFRP